MIDGDASLSHNFFEVPQTPPIGETPPDAQQNNRPIKVPALEHLFPRRVASNFL
jgi:hypothetical protein